MAAPHAEMPVEPVAGGVAQVLVEVDVVPLDLVDDDVAAREFAVNLQLRLATGAGARKRDHDQRGKKNSHCDSFSGAISMRTGRAPPFFTAPARNPCPHPTARADAPRRPRHHFGTMTSHTHQGEAVRRLRSGNLRDEAVRFCWNSFRAAAPSVKPLPCGLKHIPRASVRHADASHAVDPGVRKVAAIQQQSPQGTYFEWHAGHWGCLRTRSTRLLNRSSSHSRRKIVDARACEATMTLLVIAPIRPRPR